MDIAWCSALCYKTDFKSVDFRWNSFFLSVEAPEGPYQHAEMMLISAVYRFFPHHLGSLTPQLLNYELLSLQNKMFVVLTLPITLTASDLTLSITFKAWDTWAES